MCAQLYPTLDPLDCSLPDPGIKPTSPALQADSLLLSHQGFPTVNTETAKNKLMKFAT